MWPFKQKTPSKPRRSRAYQAAMSGRLTADWNVTSGSPDSEILPNLKTLRSRSNDLVQNNDYARRFLNLMKTNVVGPKGVLFQNKAKDLNGDLDMRANDIIEQSWRDWGKKGSATMCGGFSWLATQQNVIEAVAREGEIFVQIVNDGKYGFRLHLLESAMCDETLNHLHKNIRGGVECDSWGRPVAYYFFRKHPSEFPGESYLRPYNRISADEIIHVFVKERPGQTRGVPWLVTPAYRLKQLGGIEEAELVASRVSASKMGFFITPDGNSYEADDTDDDGALITEASPGLFEELPEGTEFKEWNPSHPNNAFEPFVKALLRGIASGLNVSYIALANDLTGVSYSSIRQGELSDRDAYRLLQAWLIENFISIVFSKWLPMAILSGEIKLPARKIEKFNQPHWMPRGWNWVDPQKEVNSNIDAVKNGFRSLSDILAESGHSVEDVFQRLAAEKKLAEKYGLELPTLFGEPVKGKDLNNGNSDS